jgi:superfamily II DNA/RNA helicase
MQQVLVFTSSIRTADNVVGKLQKNKIQAAALHGNKSQGARIEVLKKFKAGKLRVLVATDLASRGIDIKFLPHVINYELPCSPKDYVHRIGRTGRAEAAGEAISLLGPEDLHHFRVIQKKMEKRVEVIDANDFDLGGLLGSFSIYDFLILSTGPYQFPCFICHILQYQIKTGNQQENDACGKDNAEAQGNGHRDKVCWPAERFPG